MIAICANKLIGGFIMKIIGISSTTNEAGEKSYMLYITEPFPAYANDAEKGRQANGSKAEGLYLGKYDCSKLKVGDEIEVYFDKAVTTKTGTFQPVKKIEIIPIQGGSKLC